MPGTQNDPDEQRELFRRHCADLGLSIAQAADLCQRWVPLSSPDAPEPQHFQGLPRRDVGPYPFKTTDRPEQWAGGFIEAVLTLARDWYRDSPRETQHSLNDCVSDVLTDTTVAQMWFSWALKGARREEEALARLDQAADLAASKHQAADSAASPQPEESAASGLAPIADALERINRTIQKIAQGKGL